MFLKEERTKKWIILKEETIIWLVRKNPFFNQNFKEILGKMSKF